MNPIKVILFDFQFLTREGLARIIQEKVEFELTSVINESESLMEMVLNQKPDVLIMDYKSDDEGLMTMLDDLVKNPVTNVLIITNENRKIKIQQLLDMGIRCILTKGCGKQEIINAIHSIARGNRFYCNQILDQMVTRRTTNEVICEPADLSPREFEVLQLIAKGRKTVDIADQLNVSVHTINSHRKNILKKLNLKSPTELIVYAVENGMTKVLSPV